MDTIAIQQELDEALTHILNAKRLVGREPPAAGVITDREPRPLPPLPACPVGAIFTDPTFGARLLRITGPDSDPEYPGLSFRSSDSTLQRSWNATTSRFTLEDNWGRQHIFAFDPPTLRARRLRVIAFDRRRFSPRTDTHEIVPFNGSDSSWHDTNPDRLYGLSGNRVVKVFDFSTDQMTTVLDLDTLGLNLPPDSYTGNIQVMSDTLLAVCGGKQQDYHHYVVMAGLSNGEIQTIDSHQIAGGFDLHGAVCDLSARYVILVPSNHSNRTGHLYLWDRESGHEVVDVTVGTSGHLAVGFGQWVNQDCEPGTTWDAAQWTWRDCANPNTIENCIDPVLEPTEIYLAEHPSWTHMDDRSTPFVSATYRYQPSDVPWRAWDEEILSINPASGEVRRQAHHRSQVLTAGGGWDYWATPRANVSCDGRFALVTSNWGRTLGLDTVEGGDRQDGFLVELR